MLRWQPTLLAFLLVFGFLCGPIQAQSPEIDAARQKGIEFLKGEQYDDGSWSLEDHDVGITAICALALIENGVPVSDESIENAQRFIKKDMDETDGTCDIALSILFLSRIGERDSRPEIRELAARLIAGQNVEGGWGTTCPKASAAILSNPEDRPKPQAGVGDNVSTQFAVLGLWAASHWGVDIRETMKNVSDRFSETQREDGGWPIICEEWTKLLPADEQKKREAQRATAAEKEAESGTKSTARKKAEKSRKKSKGDSDEESEAQSPNPKKFGLGLNNGEEADSLPAELPGSKEYQPSDPAMTFVGLYCLSVAKAAEVQQEQHKKALPGKTTGEPATQNAEGSLLKDPSFADGLKIATQYASKMKPSSSRHFLWSVERLGVVLGMEKFGNSNWFDLGAAALVKSQSANGSWGDADESSEKKSSKKTEENQPTGDKAPISYGLTGHLAETSYALLFLRKANLGSDISRLLQGEHPDKFVIASQPEKPRFKSLEDALKTARDGDHIRIEGSGPFQVSHIDIDRNLTIEAGFGYQPIIQYDVGFDADGRRSRPQDNPETRHMFRVTQGTLTLEGLDFQMDAPELGAKVSWTGLVMKGGTLRVLNCSVSEGNKQGMAAIQVAGPGNVLLKNTQLIGGRAGVEILVSGEQHVTLDNCIIFSNVGFRAFDGENADGGKCQLSLNRCAIQTQDVFHCKDMKNALDIESQGVAFQSEWLGQNMLTSATGHAGLSWKGSDNLYDVKRWLGHAGKPIAAVKDLKTWSTFWDGAETNGTAKPIPYAVRRPVGGFNHVVKGEDYEFASASSIHSLRRKTGIEPLIVGPGPGFERYRESFAYRTWLSPSETAAAVPTAPEKPAEKPAPPAAEKK